MLTDKMLQYLETVEKIVDEHASSAVELGLLALRVDVAHTLMGKVLIVLLGIAFAFFAYKTIKLNYERFGRDRLSEEDPSDAEVALIILSVLSGIASLLLLIVGIAGLFNIWIWVGLFHPELWAIHKFILN